MITPALAKIETAVRKKFAAEFADKRLYSLGIYNRRKIAGSSTWSQHSWGNAFDIGVRKDQRPALGSKVVAFLKAEDKAGRLDVGTILWWVKDHYDHVHAEGSPKKTGTPPLPTQGDDEDMEKVILSDQTALRAAGFVGANGKPLTLDGILGPNTQFAKNARDKAAAAKVGSTVTGTFSGKVS